MSKDNYDQIAANIHKNIFQIVKEKSQLSIITRFQDIMIMEYNDGKNTTKILQSTPDVVNLGFVTFRFC